MISNDSRFSSTEQRRPTVESNFSDNKQAQVDIKPLPFDEDAPTYPQRSSRRDQLQLLAEKCWLFEIAAWLVSLLALLGIIVLLYLHQDRPNPYSLIKPWHVNIRGKRYQRQVHLTVNACLSIFATIFKASLAVPVAAALGQLKWSWFSNPKPLSHYQLYDSASRGVVGSAMLIWNLRGRYVPGLSHSLVEFDHHMA